MCVFFEGLVHSSEYYMQSIIELYIGEGVKESVGANERRRRVSGVDRRVRRLSATLISLPTQQKKKNDSRQPDFTKFTDEHNTTRPFSHPIY